MRNGIRGVKPLDGDGTDISGNGIDDTPVNAAWVTGKWGLGIYITGDDTVMVADDGDSPLDLEARRRATSL